MYFSGLPQDMGNAMGTALKIRDDLVPSELRGRANFLAVMDRVVMPALDGAGTIDPAAALAAAIDAALADPEGGAIGSALAELAPALDPPADRPHRPSR